MNPSNASGLGAAVSSPALLVTKTQSPGCWQMTQRSSSRTARRRRAHLEHDSAWPQRAMATNVRGSAHTAQHSSVVAMVSVEWRAESRLCLRMRETEQQRDARGKRERKKRASFLEIDRPSTIDFSLSLSLDESEKNGKGKICLG